MMPTTDHIDARHNRQKINFIKPQQQQKLIGMGIFFDAARPSTIALTVQRYPPANKNQYSAAATAAAAGNDE